MLIVVDGPEKAGKSTVIERLATVAGRQGMGVNVIHHGKECAGNDGSLYASHILSAQRYVESPNFLVVFDRAWPSEWVYGLIMGRDSSPVVVDPFFVERALGDVARRYGAMAILLGPSAAAIAALRTPDDHPVDPEEERGLYADYAADHNWQAYANEHSGAGATSTAEDLFTRATLNFKYFRQYR